RASTRDGAIMPARHRRERLQAVTGAAGGAHARLGLRRHPSPRGACHRRAPTCATTRPTAQWCYIIAAPFLFLSRSTRGGDHFVTLFSGGGPASAQTSSRSGAPVVPSGPALPVPGLWHRLERGHGAERSDIAADEHGFPGENAKLDLWHGSCD